MSLSKGKPVCIPRPISYTLAFDLDRGRRPMKSLWMGIAAAVVIAVVSGVVLNSISVTTADQFSTSNTRR